MKMRSHKDLVVFIKQNYDLVAGELSLASAYREIKKQKHDSVRISGRDYKTGKKKSVTLSFE
jgi:hypothetical protein